MAHLSELRQRLEALETRFEQLSSSEAPRLPWKKHRTTYYGTTAELKLPELDFIPTTRDVYAPHLRGTALSTLGMSLSRYNKLLETI